MTSNHGNHTALLLDGDSPSGEDVKRNLGAQITKRATLLALSLLVAFGLVASPAAAEGSWTSYFSGIGTGFESRRWTDNQSDSQATTSRLTGCRVTHGAGVSTSMGWELRRNRTALPDVSYGNKTYSSCRLGGGSHSTSETASWGNISQSGTFFLRVAWVNHGQASASEHYTRY